VARKLEPKDISTLEVNWTTPSSKSSTNIYYELKMDPKILMLLLTYSTTFLNARKTSLNQLLKPFSDCRVHLVLDAAKVDLCPLEIPVTIFNVYSSAPNMKNFVNIYISRHNTGYHEIMIEEQAERILCNIYFFLFYEIQLENYLCNVYAPHSNWKFRRPGIAGFVLVEDSNSIASFGKSTCSKLTPTPAIRLELELLHKIGQNEGIYALKGFTKFGESDICNISHTRLCFEQEFGLNIPEKFAFNLDFRSCEGKRLITHADINKYIGSPFQIRKLYHKLYPLKFRIELDDLEKPVVLNYVKYLHMFANSKTCFISARTKNWIEQGYYELLPFFFKKCLGLFGVGIKEISEKDSTGLLETGSYRHSMPQLFLSGVAKFRFTTCDGVRPGTVAGSFQTYFEPYDSTSWICIILTSFMAIPTVLLVISKVSKLPPKTLVTLAYKTFVASTGLLLEIGPSLNEWPLESYKLKSKFRLIFASWLMAVVVLVNAYKGVFTSLILAPPKSSHTWSHLSQLINFHITGNDWHFLVNLILNTRNLHSTSELDIKSCQCLHLGIPPIGADDAQVVELKKACRKVPVHSNTFMRLQKVMNLSEMDSMTCKNYSIHDSIHLVKGKWLYITRKLYNKTKLGLNENMLPKSGGYFFHAVPQQVSNVAGLIPLMETCDKIALVDFNNNVLDFVRLAEYQKIVKTSNEVAEYTVSAPFFERGTGVIFDNSIRAGWFYKRMYMGLRAMFEHGLYQLWEEWAEILFSGQKKRKLQKVIEIYRSMPKKLQFNANVTTVFVLWVTGSGMALVFFLSEFGIAKLGIWMGNLINLINLLNIMKTKVVCTRGNEVKMPTLPEASTRLMNE